MPTAPVTTWEYAGHVRHEAGVAGLRNPFVFTPHPVVGMPPETLYGYIEGKSPATGRPVITEIIDALTKPVPEAPTETMAAAETDEAAPLEPDTEDNLQRIFCERGWTDGLPVILPTEERVNRMLGGTARAAAEQVGEIYLRNTKEMARYTVKDIAVIAVMAGAAPEHLPVILAVAATQQSALFPSTTPFAGMLLVNGPIRNEIGMNAGIGAFSPVNRANAVIGRAWTLMAACWGFNRVKKTLWSTQGSGLIYNNMCAAENEERSVWEPFHVQQGFSRNESAVSVFRGWNMLNSLHAAAARTVGEEIDLQLSVIPALNSAATIILDPLVARSLKENDGFATKQDFSRWLSENCMIPAGRYWGTDYIDMLASPLANSGVEPYATWKKLPEDALLPHYHNPDNINIVVVGGETSPLWKTSDYGCVASESVDKWRAAAANCSDGSCGLPDDFADYD